MADHDTEIIQYCPQLPSYQISSNNPRPETIAKAKEREDLRVQMQETLPGFSHFIFVFVILINSIQ